CNSTGRLMFNMLGAIAQFERELMLERQREGIAKGRGEIPGASSETPEIQRQRAEGIGATEIAKRLRINSQYRVLSVERVRSDALPGSKISKSVGFLSHPHGRLCHSSTVPRRH